MRKIKFSRIRERISLIDRISICDAKTLSYENFITIKDVPKEYNKLYVCGIGMIESEFYKTGTPVYVVSGEAKDCVLLPCIEIVVSKRNRRKKIS